MKCGLLVLEVFHCVWRYFKKNKKFKIIFFTLIVNVMIFSGLEWVAGYLIQGENIYKNVGMMDGNHPLMEFGNDLGYKIRNHAMEKLTYTFPIIFLL